jgi:integrase
MASAWVYQDAHQVAKVGIDQASWYAGWIDPEGKRRCKSCGKGSVGQKKAEELRIKQQDRLERGTYQADVRKTWKDFRNEYEERIAKGMALQTRRLTLDALDDFERIIKPKKLAAIKTKTVDDFIAKRRTEKGRRQGDTISPATVNRQLRHLKAVLRVAHEWGYLQAVPKIRMLKEPGKLPTYVSPEHFRAIYLACDQARWPDELPFPAADWWRSLLVFAYMTGWRISEILSLKREDVDLDSGTAITRAEDNKGKRDERVKLHPVVVEHLKHLPGFTSVILPWDRDETCLYNQFRRIQEAAKVKLPCSKQHKHSPACHVYGFHDLRRAFATMNASRLTGDALKALMRHKSYLTTQRYINMARQLDEAVAVLHVPDVLRKDKAQ